VLLVRGLRRKAHGARGVHDGAAHAVAVGEGESILCFGVAAGRGVGHLNRARKKKNTSAVVI
jgi:hypothetical protein